MLLIHAHSLEIYHVKQQWKMLKQKKKIINFLPKERQTLLFSATMAPKIKKLAEKILTKPEYDNH
jgi:superfamily II DNA/RNA helicase